MASIQKEHYSAQAIFQRAYSELEKLKEEDINGAVTDVRVILRTLLTPENIENAETFNWGQQYHEMIATLERFGLAQKTMPTLSVIRNAFSPEKQEEIKNLKKPILLLVPEEDRCGADENFATKIHAMNASSLKSYYVCVNRKVFGPMERKVRKQRDVTTWRPVIVEGMQDMDVVSFDNPNDILLNRTTNTRKKRHILCNGIDRDEYALLQMHALWKGELIDSRTWTILDDDKAMTFSNVPLGSGGNERVTFGALSPKRAFHCSRFRSTIQGENI